MSLIFLALVLPFLRTHFEKWGATDAECKRNLPGDELIDGTDVSGYTHAITVNAPAAVVWPWIVQLGQDKGGWYSYELLENIVGCRIRNAENIMPEFQHLAVGDEVLMHPENGYPYIVTAIESQRTIVLQIRMNTDTNEPFDIVDGKPRKYVNQSWVLFLETVDDKTTRLISRSRNEWSKNLANTLGFGFFGVVAPIMDRRMLLGIKARAEQGCGSR